MNPRYIKLVQILQNEASPCTASNLANVMGVSSRSIKTYINSINTILPDTISSSQQGYEVDIEKAKDFISKSASDIPQTSKERGTYIINQTIKNKFVNLYDLCDELFISYSTLKNELSKIKSLLTEYNLTLDVQNDAMIITGLEKNKRKLLSEIMYSESNTNFINLQLVSENYSNIDVPFIKQTLLDIFEIHHYFVNDYSLSNLILHITISVERLLNGFVNQEVKSINFIRHHEYKLAKEIANALEKQFSINFNDSEINELTLLLISRVTNLDYRNINESNLLEYIGQECYELVKDMISDTNAFYYIDLNEQEYLVRFALHIKNLILRCKSNYFSKNPLTESIKKSCPLIYDAAVYQAQMIYERLGISINDDEIAYIAFHLGGALEIQRRLSSRLSVNLYCPNYYDMNYHLADKITTRFEENIIITNVLTTEDDIDSSTCDLIISTLPLSKAQNVKVITINPFLLESDINNISNQILNIKQEKKKNTFREHLQYLITPELFNRLSHPRSKNDLIHCMCKHMKDLGYVDDNFEAEVKERDNISSTAFDGFAIPHAMKMHALKTGMYVVLLDEAVDWDDKKVRLIMMLSFNRNERYIFNEVFEPLTMILTNKEHIKVLLQCASYQEFIDALVLMLETI